jgi:thiopeptide-type bacteriocin biosynthesis protein
MAERRWLSAHLHLRPELEATLYGEAGDRVVLDVVAPLARRALAEGWAASWFFIRYRVDGPHLRFRLHGPRERLDAEARPAIAAAAAAEERLDEVRWVDYEPELERYGGEPGVAAAEELFDASSRAAVRLLAKLPAAAAGERSARLGKGLLAALAALSVLVGERRRSALLMESFSSGLLHQMVEEDEAHVTWTRAFRSGYEAQSVDLAGFVSAAWEALCEPSGEALPAEVASLRRDLERTRQRLTALLAAGDLHRRLGQAQSWDAAVVGRLLPSYLHMTNNRLGVRPSEESYLALVAAEALGGARRRESA